MKQTIEWHGQCLTDMHKSLAGYCERLTALIGIIDRLEVSIAERESQLNMAVEQGLAEFDCEKFGKRKVK